MPLIENRLIYRKTRYTHIQQGYIDSGPAAAAAAKKLEDEKRPQPWLESIIKIP
jgi:hypothetical protein